MPRRPVGERRRASSACRRRPQADRLLRPAEVSSSGSCSRVARHVKVGRRVAGRRARAAGDHGRGGTVGSIFRSTASRRREVADVVDGRTHHSSGDRVDRESAAAPGRRAAWKSPCRRYWLRLAITCHRCRRARPRSCLGGEDQLVAADARHESSAGRHVEGRLARDQRRRGAGADRLGDGGRLPSTLKVGMEPSRCCRRCRVTEVGLVPADVLAVGVPGDVGAGAARHAVVVVQAGDLTVSGRGRSHWTPPTKPSVIVGGGPVRSTMRGTTSRHSGAPRPRAPGPGGSSGRRPPCRVGRTRRVHGDGAFVGSSRPSAESILVPVTVEPSVRRRCGPRQGDHLVGGRG